MMTGVRTLATDVGVKPACWALGFSRAGFYRHRNPFPDRKPNRRPAPPRALQKDEKQDVLDLLHSERFMDKAPQEVYATLLDEGRYHCSIRTMYRILSENKEVRERRDLLRHPAYHKPELLATSPNQVWSWDITKLLGPRKWSYFYLYVILDIFSRYTVGWMVANRESAQLATKLIAVLSMPEATVKTFSTGITRTTGIPGLDYLRPKRFIMDAPTKCKSGGKTYCARHTPLIPNDL